MPAKTCSGKVLKQELIRGQRRLRLCYRLLQLANAQSRFFEGAPPLSGAVGAAGVVPTETPSFRPSLTATPTHFVAPSEAAGEGQGVSFQPPKHQSTSREANEFNYRYGSQFNTYAGESPSTSGSFKTLFNKLGKNNHRLLGVGDCSGPSFKFCEPSCSKNIFPRGFPLRGRSLSCHLRNSRNASKGGNSHGPSISNDSRVYQLPLFSPQKRRWSETGSKFEASKSIPSLEHFKMEGIHMVRDLLRKGDFMVKIDLKDAYFTVPLAHQKFVRFSWEGTLYEFACLPFGLSIAPRVFTKIMKPVVALLRQLGIRLIIYLDDLLIMAQSKEMLNCHASTTLHLLEKVLIPATSMEFLGFLIDSQAMTLALPRDKVRKVKKECQSALNHPQVTVRELAKLLGYLTSTIQAVFPGPLHFRHLQGDKNKALAHLGSYGSRVQLSPQALEELIW